MWLSWLIILTALKFHLIFSRLHIELLNIFPGLRSECYCWSEFLSRFSLVVSVRVCRMYIMYTSRRCVQYVKASCHAIVLCSALSHDWERLSGRVWMGPHLFLLTQFTSATVSNAMTPYSFMATSSWRLLIAAVCRSFQKYIHKSAPTCWHVA